MPPRSGHTGGETFFGDTLAFVRETNVKGRHRTEVTEATEEGIEIGGLGGHRGICARTSVKGKASHRGHGGHRGGIGVGD
jgi:hypothetical protein